MKLLWFLEKQFDISLDIATWIEMLEQLQKNHEVFLFTGFRKNRVHYPALKNRIEYISSPPIPIIKRAFFYMRQIRRFKQAIKRLHPDVVMLDTMNLSLLKTAHRLQVKYGYKLFLDIRTLSVYSSFSIGGIEKLMFKKCLRYAAEKFDGITYITSDIETFCRERFGLAHHRSLVWQSGVNVELFKPQYNPSVPKNLNLLYHGSITENRQVGNLLEAMSRLTDIPVKLTLLGDGIGISRLHELSERMQLGDKVRFLPRVAYHKVPEYIIKTDAGIIPFKDCPVWNTSSPIKLFEYLACGKPVIATKIPAHTKVFKDRAFVIWIDSPDPKDIAASIRNAYEMKPELAGLGKQARDFVCKNYTWEIQAQKLEKFIQE